MCLTDSAVMHTIFKDKKNSHIKGVININIISSNAKLIET